ncbi:hypothetical protein [Salinicola socius]|uniref:Uncharacterized protein n=1 Tax=Salinicola socius TaxID=404433 RepID=A0A1Q8SNM8_9GAMM|nr:hypothetical protein [Salinicola socius]OLO03012.1 hypothetical protein BTW07_16920 [Salinicola socius]
MALNADLSDKLDAIYGLDISAAQRGLLLARLVGTVTSAGAAGTVGKVSADLASETTKAVGKQLDVVLEDLAEQALLKSGGLHGLDGKPLLDMKQLTTAQKGEMGELFGPQTVKQIVPDGRKIARAHSASEHGLDDLYQVNRPDVDYVVIEYKFVGTESKTGASGLGRTQDGRQGSESWIMGSDRLKKALGRSLVPEVERAFRNKRAEAWVIATRPDGATEVQVLDANGKPKAIDTSKILSALKIEGGA